MWLQSKYRVLADQFAAEVAELRGELSVEMHRRVASDAIAEERAAQIEQLYVLLNAANQERKDANSERLKSLDLVNTHLLNQNGPEKPPPDIKTFTKVRKTSVHASALARRADQAFFDKYIRKEQKPTPPETPSVQ